MKLEKRAIKIFCIISLPLFCIKIQAYPPDVNILKAIHTPHPTISDKPMQFVSNTTSIICISLPLSFATIGIIKHNPNLVFSAINLASSFVIAEAITYGLKYSFNKPRPFESYPQFFSKKSDGGDPSFPSGHTSAAFSIATTISLENQKWYVILPAYVWASSVAYSRMHLGVHYPSDILLGAAIGCTSSFIAFKINNWFKCHYLNKKQTIKK